MRHLGVRGTSFVDGQLDDNSRDLVLAHLAWCEQCRDAVGDERTVKAALQSLPHVAPSPEFVARLHAIAEPGGPFPPQRRPFPEAAPGIAGWRTGSAAVTDGHPHRSVARRSARVAVGALSVGALTVMLAALGATDPGDDSSPLVEPEISRFTMEHARSAGTLPFLDPAAILVSSVPGGFSGATEAFAPADTGR
jgi:anti-sigma factor RsiW